MKLGSSVIQDKKKKLTQNKKTVRKKKMSNFHDLKASEAV